MRHLSVSILTASPIIAAGLASQLARMRDPSVSVKPSITLQPDLSEIAASAPSAVIADPTMLRSDELTELRTQCAVIALPIGPTSPETLRSYDHVMTLFDPPGKLEDTLREIATEGDSDSEGKQELSPREKEVVIGIVKGLANKEIAASMNVSVNTVMTHRRNIATKLQIHSPAGLTIYAIVKKLVSLDEIRTSII